MSCTWSGVNWYAYFALQSWNNPQFERKPNEPSLWLQRRLVLLPEGCTFDIANLLQVICGPPYGNSTNSGKSSLTCDGVTSHCFSAWSMASESCVHIRMMAPILTCSILEWFSKILSNVSQCVNFCCSSEARHQFMRQEWKCVGDSIWGSWHCWKLVNIIWSLQSKRNLQSCVQQCSRNGSVRLL